MLDVHPPHGKLHGVGDFFLHLFTITIGLLIALGLEGCVERAHQHHLRDEADATIIQELRDNRKQVDAAQAARAREWTNLRSVLDFIAAREANQPYDISKIGLGFSIISLHDTSWSTAASTGALSFMEYKRVQSFASAYKLQGQFTHLQDEALEEFIELQSYVVAGADPMKIPVADLKEAEPTVRHALANIKAMQEIGGDLAKEYDDAIQAK
jgi:hypothetical protein